MPVIPLNIDVKYSDLRCSKEVVLKEPNSCPIVSLGFFFFFFFGEGEGRRNPCNIWSLKRDCGDALIESSQLTSKDIALRSCLKEPSSSQAQEAIVLENLGNKAKV